MSPRLSATVGRNRRSGSSATLSSATSSATNSSLPSTLIYTPGTSRISSNTNQLAPVPASLGPQPVTSLSVTSWRTPCPVIGQFAAADKGIVAASSDGLICFKRTEPQSFPSTPAAILDNSSVSGLAIFSDRQGKFVNVYCVSRGILHSFYRPEQDDTSHSFSVDPAPPLQNHMVSGTPAVAKAYTSHRESDHWCLIVPCQSGGLLYTWTKSRSSQVSSYGHTNRVPHQAWDPVEHVANDLGIISAVSVIETYTERVIYRGGKDTAFVAVLIASGRLHTIEGPSVEESTGNIYGPSRKTKWQVKTSTRIHHPGEVTGNPKLISNAKRQLDVLVPSAEGGIFYFVRTPSSLNEWHMIGRIQFPRSMPLATCLSFARESGRPDYDVVKLRAFVQSGGQLFQILTNEGGAPWLGSSLKPILGPGPFLD
ncbi:Uu.00g126130.m01.CDS01 [Anthostomella pinea]|uniref:Uu.00g126130.m01.CDS01 n=1 Tax=Anthostomella pinea TaxID=933095 RepID=A0AAI8YHR6_9PEZI|nr:Uu.00g126130.m01.CDS01 [Anthostomella pinea]